MCIGGVGSGSNSWENRIDKKLIEIPFIPLEAQMGVVHTGKEKKMFDNLKKIERDDTTTINKAGQSSGSSDAVISILDEINKPESPVDHIESLRKSKGPDRDNLLLGFQKKVSEMSEGQLKEARDYLVKALAEPKNKDDELLGSLLNVVNKEMDSRNEAGKKPAPNTPDTFNINPHDLAKIMK